MKIKAHVGDAASYDESLRLLLASDIVAHRRVLKNYPAVILNISPKPS